MKYFILVFLLWIFTNSYSQSKVVIQVDQGKHTISKHIYGHFAEHLGRCIYDGIYVGEGNTSVANVNGVRTDIIEALKKLKVPDLRWPGGCFADAYHWKDGIGPKKSRPEIINRWWGGIVEDNSFGTHEFLGLCEQIGAEPYLAGNGLSLHHYAVINWSAKGSAISFDKAMYFKTIKEAWKMEDIITRHSAMMDKYDPTKKVKIQPTSFNGASKWYVVGFISAKRCSSAGIEMNFG
jgi:alpha-L-arabinofuranosidase